MNGLVAAVAEAEAILKNAKWTTQSFEANDDAESDDGSVGRATSGWDTDRPYFNLNGRKRPADRYADNFSSGKRERSSQSLSPVKKKTKFNIHDKLRELYEEFSNDEALQANYQGLKVSSYLLEKLLSRMNLNVLIINLYPGNKGYSISLKVNGDIQMLSPPTDGNANGNCRSEEAFLETPRWPYEEEDLLSYIDNEELPIVLLDILEAEYSCLFYSGCIIAQIRDFRQAYPSFVCDTHHVLLKPTTQSIINDVNAIARAGSWGREERLLLESAVVLATAPPLCLEPRPAIGLLAARLHHQRHMLATPDIRRQAKRYSQVAVNRKRRLDQLTYHHGLGLLDIISKQRAKMSSTVRHTSANNIPRASSKFPKKPSEVLRAISAPRVDSPPLIAPPDVANTVALLARPYERPRTSSDCAPQLMEEYVLETERAPTSTSSNMPVVPGVFHIKLSILQRPSNQEFLGELYVDRDHVEGERNGSSCRFPLGTRAHANRYIQQFTEIFTEEGRKSVRIKHIVPGQAPKVSFTAAMREMNQAAHLARAQSLAAAAAASPAQSIPSGAATPSVQATVGGGVVSQHGLVSAIKVPPPSPAVPSPTGVVAAPAPSPEVVLVTGPSPNARRTISASLPILQAQLQAGPQGVQQVHVNQQVGSPAQLEHTVPVLKPQSQTLIHHIQLHQSQLKQQGNEPQLQGVQISPQQTQAQLQQLQNAQQAANQLLAQQLTNPPQPINPHKLQPAIIHIQHPLSSQLLQQKVAANQSQLQAQSQHMALQQQQQQQQSGITLQGQSSLSLQGQQGISVQGQQSIMQAQQQAIQIQNQQNMNMTSPLGNSHQAPISQLQKPTPPKQRTTNPAISALVTSLMNSAHQFQQQAAASAAAKSTSNNSNMNNNSGSNATILNLLNSAPAAMTNSSAGTAVLGDGNQPKKATPPSALLERLMAPPAPATPAQQASQMGLPQLQNVQVQIPGLSQPISLSLNVSTAGSTGLLVSVPVSQSTPPSTQSLLSLPITHLMAGSVKAGTPLQLVQRPRVAPRQLPTKLPTAAVPSGHVQYIGQQSTTSLAHQQRRRSNPNEPNK